MFDAEKANPIAMVADIGLLWGTVAEKKGVVPGYLPPSAEKLPAGYKGATGGWVATFAGVPALVVNNAALTEQGLPAIATWADLLKPEFKGKMGYPAIRVRAAPRRPRFSPGHMRMEAIRLTSRRPSTMRSRFSRNTTRHLPPTTSSKRGRSSPGCGTTSTALRSTRSRKRTSRRRWLSQAFSIYAPSALMLNKYNTANAEAIKAFSEFVLGDVAAAAFAKFGARPIQYVLGTQTLPDEAKANWLPEESYKDVKVIENFAGINAAESIAAMWDEEVLGG